MWKQTKSREIGKKVIYSLICYTLQHCLIAVNVSIILGTNIFIFCLLNRLNGHWTARKSKFRRTKNCFPIVFVHSDLTYHQIGVGKVKVSIPFQILFLIFSILHWHWVIHLIIVYCICTDKDYILHVIFSFILSRRSDVKHNEHLTINANQYFLICSLMNSRNTSWTFFFNFAFWENENEVSTNVFGSLVILKKFIEKIDGSSYLKCRYYLKRIFEMMVFLKNLIKFNLLLI